MSWTRVGLAIVCAAAALGLGGPASAHASGAWEWPVSGPVALGYGERYASAQGASCTHGGLDIGAAAGTTVRACVGGEVVFSGLVPAGEGARAWAVTVLTTDGLRVTYLPLERGSVSAGAAVSAGASIGELAGAGDASSAVPHLHVGVKRSDTHLDPLAFLGDRAGASEAPAAPPALASHPVTPPVPAAPPVTAGAPAAAPRHAPASATVHAPAGAPAPLSGPVPSGAIAAPSPLAFVPSAAIPSIPPLARVPSVAETPRVRTAAVAADLVSTRNVLATVLGCLGLIGLAGACLWPVLRVVLEGSAGRQPATVHARGDRA